MAGETTRVRFFCNLYVFVSIVLRVSPKQFEELLRLLFITGRMIHHFANAVFARSVALWGQKVITRSNLGLLIQHKHDFLSPQGNGS